MDRKTAYKLKKFLFYLVFYGIILGLLYLLYFFIGEKFFGGSKTYFNDSTIIAPEVQSVVEKVGKHILLPGGEVPTIATVSNINLLKGQEFFKDAKNGDKVLIYEKSKKAILYDEKADKIITIAPLVIGDPVLNQQNAAGGGSLQF